MFPIYAESTPTCLGYESHWALGVSSYFEWELCLTEGLMFEYASKVQALKALGSGD